MEKLPYLRLLAAFDNGIDAMVFLKSTPADLVFLDINMDGFSGIQLLEAAGITCPVIITTAYDQYALKGFELQVTDYLLKPYTFPRFIQAVERAQQQLSGAAMAGDKTSIFIKTEHRLEKLFLGDIIYIEGRRDYRSIHTTQKRIMTLQTFGELEAELPPSVICRVHKSFMVSLGKIESIDREGIRIGTLVIPVSDTYRKAFFERIKGVAR